MRSSRSLLFLALVLLFAVSAAFGLYLIFPHHVASSAIPSPVARATSSPVPSPPAPPAQSTATLIFGGDIMLGRWVESRLHTYGGSWPLAKLGSTMAAADLTVANLESPLRKDMPESSSNSLVLRGDPEGVASLQEAGIDLVSLANNHIPDMGLTGLQQTKQLLSAAGIAYAGAGESASEAAQPVILTRNGIRFGFLSYTYGVNFDSPGVYYSVTDPDTAAAAVTQLRSQVDMVIVLAHFGIEYHTVATGIQEAFAHRMIDAGASVVVGTHPHVDEPLEHYHDGLIFYSLGNLVFDQTPGGGRDESALAHVTVTKNGSTQVTDMHLLPYKIYDYGQPALLDSASEKAAVVRRFGLGS